VFLHAAPLGRTILFVATAFCAGVGMRFVLSHISWGRGSIARLITSSVIAIVIADLGAVVIRQLITDPEAVPFSLPVAILRLCADGLGIILLQLILNDALTRTTSERFQVEAARSRTLLAETKLLALRARIHPHFLFNTLTTIAALCRIDAGKAESATVQLAQIMRRALELDKRTLQPLGDEVEYVRDYVEIEKLRLGNRLNFVWEIEPRSETAQIPPFILQILVENAVQHGIVPKMGQGNIIVRSRAREKYILIAVQDDGVGIPRKQRTKLLSSTTEMTERTHGIGLANEQLELLYGTTARLRLFSRENCGTLVAFRIPVELSFATLQQSPLVLSRLLSPSSLKGENLTV
jgi:signal transduction histidine kinase